jgi:CheY-like chemotaxis protein
MAKILLVEDEVLIALSTAAMLEYEGHSVTIATDGQKGLASATTDAPDLILTDFMMPRMDGLAMIKAIREFGIKAPIVFATSVPPTAIPAEASELFQGYLSKPFRDADLMTLVRLLLEAGST